MNRPSDHRSYAPTIAVLLWALSALANAQQAAPESAPPGDDMPAAARSAVIDITVTPRLSREQIAVPEPRVISARPDPLLHSSARELHETLWDDLRYSGVFDMVARELYAKVPPTTAETVPFDEWVAIGASWLVVLDVTSDGGELVLDGRLFETKTNRKMLLAKRYQAKFELARKMAHTFADLVIGQVGGEPGVCNTKIAFVSDRDGGRDREIYVADYDGHNARRVTANRRLNVSPEWSPNNETVVYTSYIRGNPDLFLIPARGGSNELLFSRPGINVSAAWSPDGSRIAFASSFDGADVEIYTLRPNGTDLHRITHNRGIDTNPAWSPNGREIAFTSDRSGRPHIWLMDSEGLAARRLTKQGYFNDGAAWAPKGRGTRLAFAGMQHGEFQIFLYVFDTDSTLQLTDTGNNEAPSWSPDGRQIVFTSERGGKHDLYIMNDDGSNLRRITSGGNNLSPAWSH